MSQPWIKYIVTTREEIPLSHLTHLLLNFQLAGMQNRSWIGKDTYASICTHVEVGCRCVSVSESRLRDRGRGSYHRVIIERGMLGKDTL